MAERLDGTVALVTGASSGIGEAAALELARQGADVALVARRGDRLADLASRVRAEGREALAIEADLTDRAQAEDAVRRAVEELGRLDTLLNNAGVMLLGPIVDAPVEEWERMIDLNLKGMLYTARAALPHLLAAAEDEPRHVADLINTSSVAGRTARMGVGVYNLTKWGVNAFTESLRQEVTGRHVRVAVVEPGAVATELTWQMAGAMREASKQYLAKMEILEAQDIADAVAFIVTRPRRMAVNEILIRPTEQSH